ncbi:choice-of-anchor D domain-containing protein [Olleya aquimaris]|nr:choice-of-anchor D domain-containing protein [Olleya aquimaris]
MELQINKFHIKYVLVVLLLLAFTKSLAQCNYDINNLGGNDLVDWNGHYISNVTLAGDNSSVINNTNNTTRYTDYTTQSIDVTAGDTYNFSINNYKGGNTWGDVQIRIWIDYNNNGNYTQVFSNNFGQNNNNTHQVTGSFVIAASASTGIAKLRIQAAYCTTCGGNGAVLSANGCDFTNTYRGDVEDYTLNITQVSTTPVVQNDALSVEENSTAGVNNQVDVGSNDYVGTLGGDADDYSLMTGASNGIVTETGTDGVFQYLPNANFSGTDSFTYQLCNQFGTCDSGTVNITVNAAAPIVYCNPNRVENWNTYYITNVSFQGVDNSSTGTGGGIQDYTSESAYVTEGSTVAGAVSVNVSGNSNDEKVFVWVDFNHNGQFDDAGEEFEFDVFGNGNITVPISIDVPSGLYFGDTRMRVLVVSDVRTSFSSCDINYASGEFEDYTINIQNNLTEQEIVVSGNGVNIISGTTTTTTDNFTYFGVYDINSGATTRTFDIQNTGVADLILQAPYVSVVGSVEFTVGSQPSLTTLMPGESTSFTIAFNPDSIASYTAEVSVLSNDVDENPFTFTVQGEGAQTFPDTDGDGVPDNVDIDDDNDGLSDSYESISCNGSSNVTTTDLIFLNETFGAGTNRIQINGNYAGVSTTYCYEDGSGSCPATYNPTSVNDGDYTVHHTVTNNNGITEGIDVDVSDWAEDFWYAGDDHTVGDVNGRMAIFNAAEDPGVFYSQDISGVTVGVPIQFGFYAINLDRIDAPSVNTRNKPEVTIAIYDTSGNLLATESSGLIDPTTPAGDWVEVSASFTSPVSQFTVVLTNSQLGGQGNDLAIDDIFVKQTLCDLDGDGVADLIDLDNDNDGIPNVVELGYIDDNFDATVFNDTTNPWIDANGNGMHDAYEGLTPLDSDGDGIPNHIDLDSDNDGVFDSVEYNGQGDVDVNGDGVGDGSDYQDTVINNTQDNQDGDGLLPIVDNNDNDVDGAFDSDHGTFSYDIPLDSDGDGIPNYLDIDSNDASNDTSNGSDISYSIHASLDTNNDGIVDGNSDVDNDGLLDAFDTNNSVYGSPLDLNDSFSLFFDGRNDYVEDNNVISSGNASIMAWIKSEGDNTLNNNRVVAGQSNFYLMVNDADNSVSVVLNGGVVLTSSDIVTNNIWVHLSATTNGSETILYVNGEAQGASLGSGGVNSDASNFTIGKLSNVDGNYFHGEIDEVRVFDIALTEEEVQRTVYQELDENQSFNQGKIIPKDISTNAIGSNLVRYYKMDSYKDDITDNKVTPTIDQVTGAKLYNIKDIYFQTAPLPYKTIQDGPWTTSSNWQYGNVWDIDIVANNKDWSIVEINNNISTTASHTNLGLVIQSNKTLSLSGDNFVDNSWYLELNGTLDLPSDSQLIQSITSDLVTGSLGKILRRQEGYANKYRYNYWGTPVGVLGATSIVDNNTTTTNPNNTPFNLDMLKDGSGIAIPFTTSYDQVGSLSTYWTYTYQNGFSYYNWLNISETDDIPTGFGYIHKGVGVGTADFQYLFEGKPNNGTVVISATDSGGPGSIGGSTRTTSVLGNPYPSAISVASFIADNSAVISGEVYLWEQWAGDTHVLNQYQGGYATVNNLAGVKAYQFIGLNGDSTESGGGAAEGTKTPTTFLPVAQGFVVEIVNDGDVKFLNSQRVFKTEAANETVFFRQSQNTDINTTSSTTSEDIIKKMRLQLTTADGLGREIVMGFSNITQDDFDYGYDAKAYETFSNDLLMVLETHKMVLQAYSDITPDKVVDLNFIADGNGVYNIKATEFVDFPSDQPVFLLDNFTGTYFDLSQDQGYDFTSQQGEFSDRFDIVFQQAETLSNDHFNISDNAIVYFSSNEDKLFVKQLDQDLKSLAVFNSLGQKTLQLQDVKAADLQNGIRLNYTSTGVYVIVLKTDDDTVVNKKIIIE